MDIKSNKYMNLNIQKSLVVTAAVLCLIGIGMSIVNLMSGDLEGMDSGSVIQSNYIYISIAVLFLVYLAQVFFLQKESTNIEKANINFFLIVPAALILIETKFGTTGVVTDFYNLLNTFALNEAAGETQIFTVNIIISALVLAAIILLSLFLITKFKFSAVIVVIALITIYCFLIGQFVVGFNITLLYFFSIYSNYAYEKRRKPELLYLSVAIFINFVNSFMFVIIYLFYPQENGSMGYMGLIFQAVISLTCSILLFVTRNKNNRSLLVVSFVIYIMSWILGEFLYYYVSYTAYGDVPLSEFLNAGFILSDLYSFVISPISIMFIIALVKVFHKCEEQVGRVSTVTRGQLNFALIFIIILHIINYGASAYTLNQSIRESYQNSVEEETYESDTIITY